MALAVVCWRFYLRFEVEILKYLQVIIANYRFNAISNKQIQFEAFCNDITKLRKHFRIDSVDGFS